MDIMTDILHRHGALVLFGIVLAEQLGLPLPALPLLMAAGVLIGTGHLGLLAAVSAAFIATLLAVPGFSTIAPPLAGVVGLRPLLFLLYDALGTALWVGSGLGIGYAFGTGAPEIAAQATQLTPVIGLALMGLMGLYVTAKAWWRRAELQRAPRITAAGALEIAARQGHLDEAVGHLRAATVKEDALRYYEPPLWHYPVRHSLGCKPVARPRRNRSIGRI
jgi:membrane protein DedA with SNARE-associated domain